MKILQLISENVKCLKAVSISPKGNTVVISGKNGQGKTSCIDSIEYALGGQGAICEEPVRKGQQKARIVCDLGDIVVERTFSAVSGDSALKVKTKEGHPVKSPQAMLDQLCSRIGFDPLSFVRLKPAEQVETLRKLVGLDFAELNTKRQKLYDDRTLAGRELQAAKTRLQTFQFFPDVSDVEVSVSELMGRLNTAQAHNARFAELENKLENTDARHHELRNTIKRLEDEMVHAKDELERVSSASKALSAELSQIKKQDETAIKKEIESVTLTNTRIQANRRHQEQNGEVQKHQFTWDKLTSEIESIDQEKQDRLSWADFPLDGLSFDDNRVLLNGVPFSQCSQAQQLQAAVAIGLALNPKVRVILVRDASLLDDDSMALLAELAAKHDAQVWLERVDDSSPGAIVIENGEVKEVAA